MTRISDIKRMHESGLFNMRAIIEGAGLNYSKIYYKIQNDNELDVNESVSLSDVIAKIATFAPLGASGFGQ